MAFKGTYTKPTLTITKGEGTLTPTTDATFTTDVTVAKTGTLAKGTWGGEYPTEVTTIDASKASGAVTAELTNDKLTTLKTGKKNDKITIDSGVVKTVETGAGNDEIEIKQTAASGVNIDAGAGNDKITVTGKVGGTVALGAGNDAITVNAQVTKIDGTAGGNNTVVLGSGSSQTQVNLGKGADTVEVAAGLEGIKVTLGGGKDVVIVSPGQGQSGSTLDIADFTKDKTLRITDITSINPDNITYQSGKLTIKTKGGSEDTYDKNTNLDTAKLTGVTESTTDPSASSETKEYTIDNINATKHSFVAATAPATGLVETTSDVNNLKIKVTVNIKTGNITSVKVDSETDDIKTAPVSGATAAYDYYEGITFSANSNRLVLAKGTTAMPTTNSTARNLTYEFTKVTSQSGKADGTDKDNTYYTLADTVPYYTTTESYEDVNVVLSNINDQLIKITTEDGKTVLYEQTPSIVDNKKTYTMTNANTGSKLLANNTVTTILNTKRTKATNIVASAATSVVAGSAADTISTFADHATIDAGKGADVIVVNSANATGGLSIETFSLGTNTKKADALMFGNGINTVNNVTQASDVKLGNAVLEFANVDDTGAKSSAVNVTVKGAAWDGATKGKEILIFNADGTQNTELTKGYGDIAVSVASAANGGTVTIPGDRDSYKQGETEQVNTISYFTANKPLNVLGGELNAVAGKSKDTLAGATTAYAIHTISADSNGDAFAASTVTTSDAFSSKNITASSLSSDFENPYNDAVYAIEFSGIAGAKNEKGTVYFVANSEGKISSAFNESQAVKVKEGTDAGKISGFSGNNILNFNGTAATLALSFNNTAAGGSNWELESKVNLSLSFKAADPTTSGAGADAFSTTTTLTTLIVSTNTDFVNLNKDNTYSYTMRTSAEVTELNGSAGNDLLITNPRGGSVLGGAGNDTLRIGLEAASLVGPFNQAYANGGAGNDVYLVDGFTAGQIDGYVNANSTSYNDAKVLKSVKAGAGTDKIVFAYDTYKGSPQSRVDIIGANITTPDKNGVVTLGDGISTVKPASGTVDLTLTVNADAFNPTIGTANTTTGQQAINGAFESDADEYTYSSGENEISITNLAVGDNLSVSYKGVNYTQAVSAATKGEANGNYLGWLNPNATSITNSGKGGWLVGNNITANITGGGKNDTLVANNGADGGVAMVNLKGGEGSDVFDMRNTTNDTDGTGTTGVNITDYQAGKDKVLVDELSANTLDDLSSSGDVHQGIETVTFHVVTAADTTAGIPTTDIAIAYRPRQQQGNHRLRRQQRGSPPWHHPPHRLGRRHRFFFAQVLDKATPA